MVREEGATEPKFPWTLPLRNALDVGSGDVKPFSKPQKKASGTAVCPRAACDALV